MYLKSLTLKGFKSFADKTSMLFDPGLTVVVGPNGSGKSNVSDAILWVLGEQSAKMLRGQAMEDVIFSGSSARDPVGVAEVTLVLDNADHTLPIDFTEVAITRRMYRSGESEYLINGAPSRLMDVQDILHDSGLGKDTHSIISQGKLDSVLSSKPEERRSLIEEAADISKHRRRKERSERKLASMDDSLAKAKVVAREIARQLRPLERQVDRAREAHELNRQLSDLTTLLAVDDLRQLQLGYGRLSTRQREAEAAVEIAQFDYDERSRELERYQALLEQKGLFVGDLGEQRRRMQDVLGRMDADMRLLDEKGKNMVGRLSDMRLSLSAMRTERADVTAEHDRVAADLSASQALAADLKARLSDASVRATEATRTRNALEERVRRLTQEQRSAQAEYGRESIALAKLEDQISSAEVQDGLFQSRIDQVTESIQASDETIAEREGRKAALEAACAEAQARVEAAAKASSEATTALETARRDERAARERLTSAQATVKALRAVDDEVLLASPLAAALASGECADLVRCRLADVVEADAEVESLVERLLGDDLAALVVSDAEGAARLAASAAQAQARGRATVVMADSAGRDLGDVPGEPLLDHVRSTDPSAAGMVAALLCDIRLVGSAEEALAAHAVAPHATYVTPDGVSVLPDGRVRLGEASSAEDGSLARKRRIRALDAGMAGLEQALSDAAAAVEAAERAQAAARDEASQARGEVARIGAELGSVTSELGRLESQRDRSRAELQSVERQRQAARDKAGSARDAVEAHRTAAEAARVRAEETGSALEAATTEREEAIRAAGAANHDLNELRISHSNTDQQRRHLESRERDLARRADDLLARISATESSSLALEVVLTRVEPLHGRYEAIRTVAEGWAQRLKERASIQESDSEELKEKIGSARKAVSAAQEALDAARARLADVRVELGRIEEQVKQAIAAIQATGAILEDALELPEPEDRAAAERTVAQLKRKIADIGPVNEVAMDEYTRLKERADYIDAQVADLESARKSLAKITAAIERKMRSRFLVVFDQVNGYFSQIFSVLFPGGTAHLELTDPDHVFETGVEIVAQPRGKRITKMTLMSGGEKSLTALALLFAVYRARTVPFYVFDEVEAALDDANLGKLLDAIDQLKQTTQLIVISHQRRTMEQADVLYGVSMQADGVSRVVSQRLDKTTGRVVDA